MNNEKIISTISFMFGFMLIPSIISMDKINPITTSITMIGMYIMALSYYRMKLYKITASSMFTGTIWMILLIIGID